MKYAFLTFLRENKGQSFKPGNVKIKAKKNNNRRHPGKPAKTIHNRSALAHLTSMFNIWYRKRIMDRYNAVHYACVNKHVMNKWVDKFVEKGTITSPKLGVLKIA